jgi:hypothetical protein
MTTTTKNATKLGSTFLGTLLAAYTAAAQFTQQGAKLVASDAIYVAAVGEGSAVSLSTDGNTAVVGGYVDNSGIGAAWVYTRTGGVWSQQGNKLVGAGAVGTYIREGFSAAISGDGSTIIFGGPFDNSNVGAAWVFTLSGGVWTQQGTKLVASDETGTGQFGNAVAISSDGNTAIIGGPADALGAGAAWVFTRTGGLWSQQGTKLVGTGAAGFASQGFSAGMSSDGNTAILGGYTDNLGVSGYMGAAWVFTRTGSTWSQQGSKLVGTGAAGTQVEQGISVALSGDGNTAMVGGFSDNGGVGAAWVYTRSGGVWSQQGSKLVGTGGDGQTSQGYSVSLSSDGNTAVVGGPDGTSLIGAAWVYTRSGGAWSQLGSKLVGTGWVGTNIQQGLSVAISGDASTLIVGGPDDNSAIGTAWVFVAGAAGPANHLAFVQQPTNAVAGASISPSITVQLQDAANSPVAQAGTSITLAKVSGTGTLNGTATQTTNASGLATFAGLSVNLIGTKSLTASSIGLTGATSSPFVISASAATSLTISGGSPQHTPVLTAFGTPLQATVTDGLGNPVAGASVTFTPPVSGASAAIAGSPALTNASGVASVSATANGTAGAYSVVASSGTLPPVNFALTNDAALAASSVPALGTAGLVLLGLALATLGASAVRRISS